MYHSGSDTLCHREHRKQTIGLNRTRVISSKHSSSSVNNHFPIFIRTHLHKHGHAKTHVKKHNQSYLQSQTVKECFPTWIPSIFWILPSSTSSFLSLNSTSEWTGESCIQEASTVGPRLILLQNHIVVIRRRWWNELQNSKEGLPQQNRFSKWSHDVQVNNPNIHSGWKS